MDRNQHLRNRKKKIKELLLSNRSRLSDLLLKKQLKKLQKEPLSAPPKQNDSFDLDAYLTQEDKQTETEVPVPLNFLKRQAFEAKDTDLWKGFMDGKGNLAHMHSFVESSGFFLPPLKSKPISMNYCIGVYEKYYFCLENVTDEPAYYKKVSTHVYYYEIVRAVNQHLGYDNNNLPPLKYLAAVLYNINREHYFFSRNRHMNLPMMPDSGLFLIPESCQGFLASNNTHAQVATRVALQNERNIQKTLINASNTVRYIEVIKEMLQKLRKTIEKTPYTTDTFLTNINNHFKNM